MLDLLLTLLLDLMAPLDPSLDGAPRPPEPR